MDYIKIKKKYTEKEMGKSPKYIFKPDFMQIIKELSSKNSVQGIAY